MDKKKSIIMVIAVVLTSASFRSPITGVGSLAATISSDLSMNATVMGLITTLPLLAYAVVSLFTSALGRKFGAGNAAVASLVFVAIGIALRSYLGLPGLFIGTIIIGLGTGVNNILLPALIKAYYPKKIGLVTGLYSMFMAGFASLSGGISVPIALSTGWRFALFVWIFLVAAAVIFWLPNHNAVLSDRPLPKKRRSVARSSVTWWVTVYMGCAGILFYAFVAWFATILQSKGYSETSAGLYNSLMMLCGLPFALIMPVVAQKAKNRSVWAALIGLAYAIGMFSAIYAENPVFLWVSVIGAGIASGGAIAYIMVLIGLHTRNADDASSLSAFSQGVGYLLAALGPVLIGKLFDLVQNWTVPLLVLTGVGVVCMISGWFAGLDRYVETGDIAG